MGWLSLLLLAGCGDVLDLGVEPVPGQLSALDGDPVVRRIATSTAPAPVPVWADGTVPGDPASLSAPERAGLTSGFCRGGDERRFAGMRARLMEEAQLAVYPGPWTSIALEECMAPGAPLCRWIGAEVQALPADTPVPGGLFTLWHVAGGCKDPGIWAWMPREGGAQYGTVDFLATQDSQWRPVADPAVPGLVSGLLVEPGLHRDRALQALGAMDHPGAARALIAHYRAQPDEASRDGVSLWMYRQSEPEARRAFEGSCARLPTAWQCVEGLDPLADLTAATTGANTDLSSLIARFPAHRGAVMGALEDCVQTGMEGSHDQGGRCLRAMAGAGESDRAMAVVEGMSEERIEPNWVSRRRAWVELGGTEGIRAHFEAVGLLGPGVRAADPSEPPVYPVDWLLEGGRGLLTTGLRNGAVLAELLGQIPGLESAVVVVREPSYALSSGPAPHAELLVWLGDRRYRATAAEGLDELRLAALANELAEAAGLRERVMAVAPGQLLVWGPEEALRAVVEAGYLDPMEPAEAPVYAEEAL